MNYSPQLTIGPFVDAALMLKPPHVAPLASCWGGRLAALWNMEAEVSYQEFMSMTIYRMPLRLVEPAAIQQMKDLEAELHLLAAGWILEEEHDPSVAYYLGRDPRLADVLVNAMAGAVELIEREIVARLPGAGPDASSPKTGNGIFAICLYPNKIMAYLFDVTMLNWNDRRSYGIQAQAMQAVLSQPATGPVPGRLKITGRAFY